MVKERCNALCKVCDVIFSFVVHQLHHFQRFYLPDTFLKEIYLTQLYLSPNLTKLCNLIR